MLLTHHANHPKIVLAHSTEKHCLLNISLEVPTQQHHLFQVYDETELYKKLGKTLSGLVPPWQMYLLTSEEEFEKLYGKRSNKARKLYNGMIKCYLYQYFKDFSDKKPFKK